MNWLTASLIVVLMWGVVGLFQKIGSNHSTSNSLLIWTTVGYLVLIPFLLTGSQIGTLSTRSIVVGTISGFTNSLGAYCLYVALERGAAASVAVPLTALNPLLTLMLAFLVLGERLTITQGIGVVLALAAGVLLSYESDPAKETAK